FAWKALFPPPSGVVAKTGGKEDPKDKPKEDPKDDRKDKPKEDPKDKPKDNPKDKPKDDPKDKPKENKPDRQAIQGEITAGQKDLQNNKAAQARDHFAKALTALEEPPAFPDLHRQAVLGKARALARLKNWPEVQDTLLLLSDQDTRDRAAKQVLTLLATVHATPVKEWNPEVLTGFLDKLIELKQQNLGGLLDPWEKEQLQGLGGQVATGLLAHVEGVVKAGIKEEARFPETFDLMNKIAAYEPAAHAGKLQDYQNQVVNHYLTEALKGRAAFKADQPFQAPYGREQAAKAYEWLDRA